MTETIAAPGHPSAGIDPDDLATCLRVIAELDDLPADHAGEGPLAIEPRLIELCFQTAGVWELGTSGRMALPTHVDRAQLFDREGLAPGGRWAIVTPREAGVSDADVVDATGRVLLRLEGYRTIELPGGPGETELAPIREAMS